ncbi:MAG: HAD-IB family hydrolase [Actinomycetaceae bacterium]|nr:HAD-IB family hydrolase [Actinomycetaceae bacterium]
MNTSPKRAAFCDVDQTLVRGASSYHLARELYRRGFFGLSDLWYAARQSALYVACGEDPRRIRRIVERALHMIAGHHVDEVVSVGRHIVADMYSRKLFEETLGILRRHEQLGHEVWLLSATPQEVTELLAEHVGATGALGTRVRRQDGIYVGELASPIMHGPEKAHAARELARERGFELADCWAYSDSASDLPLLRAVGHPCAINPDPKLRAVARESGWPILELRRAGGLLYRRGTRRGAYVAGGWWVYRYLRKRFGRSRQR